jgi:transcriptional regulator with XRE-family HTH domain
MNLAASLPPSSQHRLQLLAARLRTARKQRGWTQERLARAASIGLSTVRAIEKGEAATAIGNYLAVLWALDLDSSIDGLASLQRPTSLAEPVLDNNF